MSKQVLTFVTALLLLTSFLSGQDPDLQNVSYSWELRGSLAVTRMNSLLNELEAAEKTGSNKKTLSRIAGEIAIESAYALHKHLPETARKKVDSGMICHLVLNAGDKGLFELEYQYSTEGELVSSNVDRLPEGWRVRLPEGDFHSILVTTDKDQVFAFRRPV